MDLPGAPESGDSCAAGSAWGVEVQFDPGLVAPVDLPRDLERPDTCNTQGEEVRPSFIRARRHPSGPSRCSRK
eukprot:3710130-Pyramimonas_sp.AAC.1